MAFNSNDLYTVSGGVTIFNYWNQFVTKHDTSSFYNWEQDNLPLYDLEERTHYLWEKFGYPLSAVPGMALVVSSSIPTHMSLSSNVFTSVSAAIEALPEVIRMPTLIEVAVSGDIGPLHLNNIKCEEDGALEIINRGSIPIAQWEQLSGTGDTDLNTPKYVTTNAITDNYLPDTLSGQHPVTYAYTSSALSVSANLAAKVFPAENSNGFFRHLSILTNCASVATGNKPAKSGYSFAGVGDGADKLFTSVGGRKVYVSPIHGGSFTGTGGVTDSTINTLDLSTNDPIAPSDVKRLQGDTNQIVNGIITANRLSDLRVQNCDGPIYLRGFIVDGYNGTSYDTEVGIGVYNSTDVSIEDCGAMRCDGIGYEIDNSKVKLRRRNISARNYSTDKRGNVDYETYGFKISNSEVEYKVDQEYSVGAAAELASHFHTYGIYLSNSKLFGGDMADSLTESTTIDNTRLRAVTPLHVGYNDFGIHANSSKYHIKGLTDSYNNRTNIKGINSEFRMGRFTLDYAIDTALDLTNSKFILNSEFRQAIRSTDSTIWNGSEKTPWSRLGSFAQNGQHIHLKEGSYYGPEEATHLSSYDPSARSALADRYNMIEYNESFGSNNLGSDYSLKPSICLNNSRAVMPASMIRTYSNQGTSFSRGTAILANNGSTCKLVGFSPATHLNSAEYNNMGTTFIKGGTNFQGQQKSSAIAATNNSTVFVTGPTAIIQYGIGLLSDNNSVVKACPVLGNDDSSYDGSGWGRMQDAVSTALEIHSTRAGAVASNNSQLIFEDMGNFLNLWPNPESTSSADYAPLGTTTVSLSSIIAAGCLQFYPNPVDSGAAISTLGSTNFNVASEAANPLNNVVKYDTSVSSLRILYKNAYSTTDHAGEFRDEATRGGVCVLATKDSEVIARNVNFPTGFANTDKSYFDPSASVAGCNDLFIWNFQDSSRLNASYASVSGVYPSLTGYTGPRAFYHSGVLEVPNESSAVAYTAFSGTPDTGTLAVLDHYGSGVDVSAGVIKGPVMGTLQTQRLGDPNTYGTSDYENRGPFRLFLPVSPAAKVLAYKDVSSVDTKPYQHLAQGYALSGEVSASNEMSSVFPELLNPFNAALADDGATVSIAMSGWYFPDSIRIAEDLSGSEAMSSVGWEVQGLVPEYDPTNIMVDESFSNTFSNAKHCNARFSGRRKLVTIYRAKTDENGEAYPGPSDASGYGMGFTSTNIFDVGRDI